MSEPNISLKITSPPPYTHSSFSEVGRFAAAAQGRTRDARSPGEGLSVPAHAWAKLQACEQQALGSTSGEPSSLGSQAQATSKVPEELRDL